MPITCLLDKTTHATREDLHAHLRGKLKQESYYVTYHPRFDLADGRPIPFKNVDQYLSSDFVDKNSLKKWLKADSPEARTWAIEWLKRRKEEKDLIYAPSETELRTLMAPYMEHYQKMGGYYEIARSLGYQDRYVNETPIFGTLTNASIIYDTREKNPLTLPMTSVRDTLNVGDYALGAAWDKGIRIERKSLQDLCGSMSDRLISDKNDQTPFKRFDAELSRAQKANLYVIMAVECDINTAQSFNHLPYMRHVKASPSYILKNLRDLLIKYPLHFQTIFFDGRIDMAVTVGKLFSMGEQVKRVDLQYAYERGKI